MILKLFLITNMKLIINKIKIKIADPFWDVFGELINDKTNYMEWRMQKKLIFLDG